MIECRSASHPVVDRTSLNDADERLGAARSGDPAKWPGRFRRSAALGFELQAAMLDIGPKDFEKLTVAIALPDDAPAGSYELTLALGPKQPDLSLALDVTERSIRD